MTRFDEIKHLRDAGGKFAPKPHSEAAGVDLQYPDPTNPISDDADEARRARYAAEVSQIPEGVNPPPQWPTAIGEQPTRMNIEWVPGAWVQIEGTLQGHEFTSFSIGEPPTLTAVDWDVDTAPAYDLSLPDTYRRREFEDYLGAVARRALYVGNKLGPWSESGADKAAMTAYAVGKQ